MIIERSFIIQSAVLANTRKYARPSQPDEIVYKIFVNVLLNCVARIVDNTKLVASKKKVSLNMLIVFLFFMSMKKMMLL